MDISRKGMNKLLIYFAHINETNQDKLYLYELLHKLANGVNIKHTIFFYFFFNTD